MLGLGHDTALAAPAVQGRIGEVVEPAGGLAGRGVLGFGLGQRVVDFGQQAGVAGEAEDVVDAVVFAPDHELVPGEAGTGPQQDLDLRPARADLANDTFDLGHGTG
jgi:hypothetical protein